MTADHERFLDRVQASMGFELADWQRAVVTRVLDGRPPEVPSARGSQAGKVTALVVVCTWDEYLSRSWDVVGDRQQSQVIRRRARELAAAIAGETPEALGLA